MRRNASRISTFFAAASCILSIGSTEVYAQGGATVADGLRLISPTSSFDAQLVDNAGTVVHTWSATGLPGLGVYLDGRGDLVRTLRTPGPSIAGGTGGGVQRYAFDGSLQWEFRYDTNGNRSHHDIAILPNGNILMIAWESFTQAQAIAHGRDPAITPMVFRPDHIIEVEETGPTSGRIVWEWHAWDHVVQDFDPNQANFGVVGNHPELIDLNYPPRFVGAGDWHHSNGIDYDPVEDWIVLSVRNFSEIWIIDHSTTTQEAAGHSGGNRGRGGDLLYRWGNPLTYRAGAAMDQQLFGQHNGRMIPPGRPGAGNMTIFNNNAGVQRPSEAIEIALPARDASGNFPLGVNGRYGPAAPIWSVTGPFNSSTQSSAERLPNGNTLVCSAAQAGMFEFSPTGALLWQYQSFGALFHAQYIERNLWTRAEEISLAAGGTSRWDLIAGSAMANRTYLILGSASGTSPGFAAGPVTVPLQIDDYLRATLSSPGMFPLSGTVGTLDALGRARASFQMSAGLLPPSAAGLHLDHAAIVFDAAVANPVLATNSVPLTLGL